MSGSECWDRLMLLMSITIENTILWLKPYLPLKNWEWIHRTIYFKDDCDVMPDVIIGKTEA